MGYYLITPRCPCYCGGEGFIMLVTCLGCGTVMGRCDEVDELIRDVRNPKFVGDESVCHPNVLCPKCGQLVTATSFRQPRLKFRHSAFAKNSIESG